MNEHVPSTPAGGLDVPASLGWLGFSADRGHATTVLSEAYADGRLTHDEYDERMDRVAAVRTMGEFEPLVSDLMIPTGRTHSVATTDPTPEQSRQRWLSVAWRGWLVLALFFNVGWLLTVISNREFIDYWPFWPLTGAAFPMLMIQFRSLAARQHERRGSDKRSLER